MSGSQLRTGLHIGCKNLSNPGDLTTFTLTSGRRPLKIVSPFVAPPRVVILEAEKYLAGIFLCRDEICNATFLMCVWWLKW